jgi:hypothetical protein
MGLSFEAQHGIGSMQEGQFSGLISAFNTVKLLLIYNPLFFFFHCGMARLLMSVEGVGLQEWRLRIGASILRKQSLTADGSCSSWAGD